MLVCVVHCVSVGVRLPGEVTGSRSSSEQKVVGCGRSHDAKASRLFLQTRLLALLIVFYRALHLCADIVDLLAQWFHIFIFMRHAHTPG